MDLMLNMGLVVGCGSMVGYWLLLLNLMLDMGLVVGCGLMVHMRLLLDTNCHGWIHC